MILDPVEQQLEQIDQRLNSLEELLERHLRMLSCTGVAPSPRDAENLAAAVSNLLLSLQQEVANSHGFGSIRDGDEFACRFSELDKAMMEIFNRPDAPRPQ